jgi:hypothetical protein
MPEKPSVLGPILATIAGNLADGGSTMWALKQPGTREVNPLLGQNPAAIFGLKAAITVPQILLEKYLANHGHPKAAKILGYTLGGLGAGLAAHNIAVGRQGAKQ